MSSWLNINESLNSIKGQLSSFANGVLNEGIVTRQEDEPSLTAIGGRNETGDRNDDDQSERRSKKDVVIGDDDNTTWSWPSDVDKNGVHEKKTLLDLRAKIETLEEEKRELIASLEQLDLDCQQTTDKLVALKDDLQSDHDALKADHDKLKQEYGEVLAENMEKTKRIQALTTEADTLREENQVLVRRLQEEDDSREIQARKTNHNLTFGSERSGDELLKENERLQADYRRVSGEKDALHHRYLNIITESMKRYVDDAVTPSVLSHGDNDEQVSEFAGKVETLLRLLLDFKSKTETLEAELCAVTRDKTATVAEKNFEIEKLLKNSEILSREVITKSRTIKEYEDECAELVRNNDLLITELQNYKDNVVGGGGGLQTIPETNEDNLLLLESQLETATKRIHELEVTVGDLEGAKHEGDLETDYIRRQLNVMGRELNQSARDLQEVTEERDAVKSSLDKTRSDYENAEYKYTELKVAAETLKEENEECALKNRKLEALHFTLENEIELLRKAVEEHERKIDLEAENNEKLELQVRNLTEKLQNSKMCETGLKLQVDTVHRELQAVTEAKQSLETKWADLELQGGGGGKLATLEREIAELTTSRNELIALITAKHQENVCYHDEIQRLTLLLATVESEKVRDLEKVEETEKLTEQNGFLRQKCEVLAQNLLEEQARSQETRAASERELERLRAHLVEIEDTYTQELLQAERKNKEMQAKVTEMERRERDSSSIYTSVSIRANQQVETLQTQLQLVTNQRDELRGKLSDLEDENNKQAAALTNLQLVLEQFQKDKEEDVRHETERVRRQLSVEARTRQELQAQIDNLKLQLEESRQGLHAASRLADQLENAKRQAVALKNEASKLQEQLLNSERKFKDVTNQNESRIDKLLIKNLIIGYVTSNSNDQNQILKIIATVLDFNQRESEKVQLNRSQQGGGWLSSILNPQHNNNNSQDNTNRQSLAEAFVRFLENESKPKVLPNLLTSTKSEPSTAGSVKTTPRQSPHVLSEVMLPTFTDFGKNRNSSSILKDVLKDNN